MRITKKVASVVLAILMVATMMSVMAVSASAAGESFEITALGTGATGAVGDQFVNLNDAIQAAGDNGSVKLIADIEFDGNSSPTFVSSKNSTTFDLNGHTITSNQTAGINLSSTLPGVVTFTVKDTSAAQTGEIITTVRYTGNACISGNTGREIVIESGKFTSDGKALYVEGKGATINGGTFDGDIYGTAPVEINDGTINGDVTVEGTGFYFDAGWSSHSEPSTATITGGTIDGDVIQNAASNAITISGGTISGGVVPAAGSDSVTVTGGTIAKTYVARIGSTGYETLQAALTAAPSGSTVTLITDINDPTASYKQNRTYGIEGKSKLTIDGDGHTVTISNPNARRGFGIWYNETGEGADITFKDITIYNYTDDSRAIDTRGNNIKSLTLDNVTMDCPSSAQYSQTLTIGGSQSTPLELNIINGSKIISRNYYAIITFNPVNATITNSTIDGWACIYAKGPDGSVGSDGSVYNITDSVLRSACVHGYGHDNNFSMITMHDCSNVEVNISNTEIYLEGGNNIQSLVNSGDFAHSYDITGNEVNFGTGNTVNLADEKAVFTIDEEGLDFEISGGTFTKKVPVAYCAEDYYPVSDGSGNYTVDSLVAPSANNTEVDATHFGLGNITFNDGSLLGVQLKGANGYDEHYTSESGQEKDDRDLRFVAAIDTELLKAAEDYGFVLAKADDTKGDDPRTCDNTNFDGIKYNGGNGEKTLSAWGTKNNIAGAAYGDPDSETATEYKFVTCAVNNIESGKKIVARFFVKVNGKVYYMNYTNDHNDTFSGCVAGISGGSIY